MSIPRRRFLRLAAAGLVLPALPRRAVALDYPTRPVRMIVGFPAGGSADIVARIVAQALTERLGQTLIVENKPGAGSNFGTEAVARARPDGYTLMADSVSNAINPSLYRNLNYDQV
jgi:tripartite-type tricarboxylate transporter receptor subunit TctC